MTRAQSAEKTVPAKTCDRREEILDAATKLFAEQGFTDAVTQLLADTLQVGKGTIYRYFPSKRELFLAATDRVMRRLQERIKERVQGIEDPLDQVYRGTQAYLEFFRGHPEYVELLIQERAHFRDRDRPTYFEHRAKNVERWRQLYRDQIAQGRVRPMSVERITDVVIAAMYGSIFLDYFGGRGDSFSARAEDIIDVVFFGILSDSERGRWRAETAEPTPADSAIGQVEGAGPLVPPPSQLRGNG